MSNVVSLQGRGPNKRLAWMERDPAEGYVVRTNYGEGRCAADIATVAEAGSHDPQAGVVAAMFAAFLLHRDGARIAPGAEFAPVLREIYDSEFGAGQGAA